MVFANYNVEAITNENTYVLPVFETSDVHGYIAEKNGDNYHYLLSYISDKVKDVRGYDNYDEVHELVVSCLKKFANKELNMKSVQVFLNYIKIVGNMKPTKFIDCVNYPERYDVILKTLHHLIDNEGDKNAALVIISAQEETLIKPTSPRKAFITEFNLNKSGFEKYMTMYMNGKGEKDIQKKKEFIKESLRALIKYTKEVDGGLRFNHGIKKRDILKLILNFLKR